MKKKLQVGGARLQDAMPKDEGPEESQEPQPYETENHMRTLMDAHEIMNNPHKMKAVHKLAGRHANAIRGIKDIQSHYNMKYGGKNARGGVSLDKLNAKSDMDSSGDGGDE